jgi:hypothetical protein
MSKIHFQMAYLFPCIHFCACLTFSSGIWVPRLEFMIKGFLFLTFADFPVSIVAIGLGWSRPALGLACYFVLGTWWWYLLGRRAEKYLKRRGSDYD